MTDPLTLPFASLPDRKIKEDTCKFYGVRVSYDGSNGEQDAHYYPITKAGKTTGWKVRKLPKEFFSMGDAKGNIQLFGQAVVPASGKRLLITGGELDCLASYQILKESRYGANAAVVSLPKGENTNSIRDNLEFILSFEEVIIYTDMDEPGRKAADGIAKLIGPKARIMKTSEKDASDMLVKGKQQEFLNAYFHASIRRPEGIISGRDIKLEDVKKAVVQGYDTQYPAFNKMLGGLRRAELTTLTAGSGIGKSTLARELAYHLRSVHDLSIGNMFLEEPLSKTTQGYIALDNNIPLRLLRKNPSLLTDKQWQDSYDKLIAEKWFGYDHFGSMPTEDLLDKLRHLAYGEGCDFIFIDHLSLIFSGQKNDNERLAIDNAMTELAAFVNESQVGIVMVSHLSRNKNKGSFNEGAHISLNDLRGSAALEQLSWNVIGLERDQQAGADSNLSKLRILKAREDGWTGEADTCEYSFETGRLLPVEIKLGDY